jgi:hypothetical protein
MIFHVQLKLPYLGKREELKLDFDDVIEWKVDVEKGHKFARVRKLE